MKTNLRLLTFVFLFFSLLFFMSGCTGKSEEGAGEGEGYNVVPTTLDVTLRPMREGGQWKLGIGPGEPHILRDSLGTYPTRSSDGKKPLSIAYFMVFSDVHQTDEESPTRLTFFDSNTLLYGMFSAAYRPQEDLEPHLLNALVRTANRIQVDYERDFDFALSLGDNTDNAQLNEMLQLIDILDGSNLSGSIYGYARIDSGDLDVDPNTGLNKGARNFEIQEFDSQGNNINAYNRVGYPNSNADIPVVGLRKSDGSDLPWFTAIGNHDVLNTGNFNPYEGVGFYSAEDYTGNIARYGFIPGIARTILYWKTNPQMPIYIADGIFGINMNWALLFEALDFVGMIPDNYVEDIDWRFNLEVLQRFTPTDTSDDGVLITPDENRAFMGRETLIPLLNGLGHGFSDNNGDGNVDALDGGYYVIDYAQINPDRPMPLRIIVLDSADEPTFAEGGYGEAQLNWLKTELDKAVLDQVLVIVASHHTEKDTVKGKDELQRLLNNCPNVILHLVGHGHYNMIEAHPSEDGDPLKGYWEVETASNADFPQQARIIEIVDNRDGTGSIYLTLFDHWQIVGDDSDILAELGRQLAFYDAIKSEYETDGTKLGGSGPTLDRNCILKFQIPPDVADKLAQIESDLPITSEESLGKRYKQ